MIFSIAIATVDAPSGTLYLIPDTLTLIIYHTLVFNGALLKVTESYTDGNRKYFASVVYSAF